MNYAVDSGIASARPEPQPGHVYLVGAGPGDPELLTIRGARLIRGADVIVYDNLVSPELLELAPTARHLFVGKKAANHTLPQEQINTLLIDLARQNLRTIRLKGGDPFLFGRGGEEMQALTAAGIPVHIIPGITAAAGIAACTGIPLTHREHAHSVLFTTGFLKNGALDLDWPLLARSGQTLVIYMGVSRLGEICTQLIAHGLDANTCATVIERGTTQQQRQVRAPLIGLSDTVYRANIRPPALVIIGEVVALQEALTGMAPVLAAQKPPFSAWQDGLEPESAIK